MSPCLGPKPLVGRVGRNTLSQAREGTKSNEPPQLSWTILYSWNLEMNTLCGCRHSVSCASSCIFSCMTDFKSTWMLEMVIAFAIMIQCCSPMPLKQPDLSSTDPSHTRKDAKLGMTGTTESPSLQQSQRHSARWKKMCCAAVQWQVEEMDDMKCVDLVGSKQKLEIHPGLDNFVPKLRSVQPASCSDSWMRFSQGSDIRHQFCPFARFIFCVWPLTMVYRLRKKMLLNISLRHFVAEPWPHFHQHWGGRVGCGYGNWNILNAMAVGTKVFNATSKSIAVPLLKKCCFDVLVEDVGRCLKIMI